MRTCFRKFITQGILLTFLLNAFCPMTLAQAQAAQAGSPVLLPKPGTMVHLSQPMTPPILKGIKVDPNNPFRFEFILDVGDAYMRPVRTNDSVREESTKLIKYFLASITTPETDLWVNLSPYEKDRIIPNSFGLTEMGRDLLAQDYMLKQITASLIYPEDELGKKFWKRIYEEAQAKYGTTNIPVNTFNKVWIVPDKAVVYENSAKNSADIDGAGHTAYVVESRLKVMLEVDYLSLEKNIVGAGPRPASFAKGANQREGAGLEPARTDVNQLGSQIVREIVIPALTREVNEGANFAQLRQVYNSLILATWYKKKIKDSILSKVYADQNKVAGIGFDNVNVQTIYNQYLAAFKKGVYNYIKEEPTGVNGEAIPRKYFSGGFDAAMMTPTLKFAEANEVTEDARPSEIVTVDLAMANNEDQVTISPTASVESIAGRLKSIDDRKAAKWRTMAAQGILGKIREKKAEGTVATWSDIAIFGLRAEDLKATFGQAKSSKKKPLLALAAVALMAGITATYWSSTQKDKTPQQAVAVAEAIPQKVDTSKGPAYLFGHEHDTQETAIPLLKQLTYASAAEQERIIQQYVKTNQAKIAKMRSEIAAIRSYLGQKEKNIKLIVVEGFNDTDDYYQFMKEFDQSFSGFISINSPVVDDLKLLTIGSTGYLYIKEPELFKGVKINSFDNTLLMSMSQKVARTQLEPALQELRQKLQAKGMKEDFITTIVQALTATRFSNDQELSAYVASQTKDEEIQKIAVRFMKARIKWAILTGHQRNRVIAQGTHQNLEPGEGAMIFLGIAHMEGEGALFAGLGTDLVNVDAQKSLDPQQDLWEGLNKTDILTQLNENAFLKPQGTITIQQLNDSLKEGAQFQTLASIAKDELSALPLKLPAAQVKVLFLKGVKIPDPIYLPTLGLAVVDADAFRTKSGDNKLAALLVQITLEASRMKNYAEKPEMSALETKARSYASLALVINLLVERDKFPEIEHFREFDAIGRAFGIFLKQPAFLGKFDGPDFNDLRLEGSKVSVDVFDSKGKKATATIDLSNGSFTEEADKASIADPALKGGIDFNADRMNLETRNEGGEINFKFDSAQFEQFQGATGFVPVIINIRPLTNLRMFLGIKAVDRVEQLS